VEKVLALTKTEVGNAMVLETSCVFDNREAFDAHVRPTFHR
jgi:hypothetical protein